MNHIWHRSMLANISYQAQQSNLFPDECFVDGLLAKDQVPEVFASMERINYIVQDEDYIWLIQPEFYAKEDATRLRWNFPRGLPVASHVLEGMHKRNGEPLTSEASPAVDSVPQNESLALLPAPAPVPILPPQQARLEFPSRKRKRDVGSREIMQPMEEEQEGQERQEEKERKKIRDESDRVEDEDDSSSYAETCSTEERESPEIPESLASSPASLPGKYKSANYFRRSTKDRRYF